MNGGAQSLEHVDSRKKTQMITVNHALIRTRRKVAGRAPVAVQPALSRVGSVFGPALILVPSYCGEELLPPGVLGDGVLLPLLGVALPGLVVVLLPESEAPPAVPAAPLPPEAPLVAVADLLLVVDFFLVEWCFLPPWAGMPAESEGMVVWACASLCACCSTAAIFCGSVLSVTPLLASCANDAADRVQSETKMAMGSLFMVCS